MKLDELSAAFVRHISPGKAEYYAKYEFDVVMGQREGSRFSHAYDDRTFINCHCNGGVFNLGHRNERVIAAVTAGLAEVDIGNHHLLSPHRAALAQRLSATTNDQLERVVFGVSGGEAIDLALKVARGATGRTKIVSANGGYHGHTGLAMAAGDAEYRDPFGPNLPGFTQVAFDDLAAMDAAITDDVAAVILEPIPATLGMPIPSDDYLPGVSKLCRDRGAKLILDEVQTGLGRTGRVWCYQHYDVRPDAIVAGKGLSGAIVPITATLMTTDLHDLFLEHPFAHISTFGGAEIACVAALEVLDIIEAPGFLDRVNALSDRFAEGLRGAMFDLRRKGLMMALKFPVADAGKMAAKMLIDAGLFVVYANNDTSCVQFLPPLTISDEEATQIIDTVRKTLG